MFNSVDERFWAKVQKIPNGCWLWIGACTHKGYGRFNRLNRKKVKSHRWSWENKNGSIPVGKMVLHSCIGQRNCVNPDHLRLGTAKENSDDMVKQGRHSHAGGGPDGEFNGQSKLTEKDVLEIRENYASGEFTQKELAKMCGVSQPVISRILAKKLWGHV